ncbi:MAG: acetylornithine/succinylornithine family transaminase [Bacteroidetes bacterium]|nr:acetylornithine/succinylornithine family transaminase [Bacteroidota bacterium]MCL5738600.1 acetylornithine/succinylornithine family transaminase [Bacteroidota bacterium]
MNLQEKESTFLLQTYKRLPVEVDHADGVYIYGKDRKKYLDFFGGLAVNALGYNNVRVKAAIVDQIDRYMHMSNMFYMDVQIEFAEMLCKLSGYPKVFLTNSGTEAIEAAIKLSRKWGKKEERVKLFALSNSFHGRTLGSLSLTDRPKYRQGFEPFVPEINHIGFNNVSDLRQSVDKQTAAVFIEFIQGEGGVNVVSDEFVDELFSLKQKYGFLVIADEIQSGIYRTGKFFAFEHYGARPDMVTVAKPIGGGLPLGGLLVDPHLVDVMGYGAHGTTFGGNPVSCAAGLATLKELSEREIVFHVTKVGGYLKQRLLEFKAKHPDFVTDVRGLGLMIGVECKSECGEFVSQLLSDGVLASCTNGNVIRLLPPLVIQEEHVDILISKLEQTFTKHTKPTTN